jgi:hypothetical protein
VPRATASRLRLARLLFVVPIPGRGRHVPEPL